MDHQLVQLVASKSLTTYDTLQFIIITIIVFTFKIPQLKPDIFGTIVCNLFVFLLIKVRIDSKHVEQISVVGLEHHSHCFRQIFELRIEPLVVVSSRKKHLPFS